MTPPFVIPEYLQLPRDARAPGADAAHDAASLILTPSNAAALDSVMLRLPAGKVIRVTLEAADPRCVPSEHPDVLEVGSRRLGITGLRLQLAFRRSQACRPADRGVPARSLPDLPDGELVIGGKAYRNCVVYPPLQPVIDRFGVRKRVIVTGWLGDAEKSRCIVAATVYATPSVYEGFGLTALEAMACGIPVIAANRSSLPEIVGDAGY